MREPAGWSIFPKTRSSFPRWPSDTSNFACEARGRPAARLGYRVRAAAGDDGISFAPPLELPQPLPVHATVAGERYELRRRLLLSGQSVRARRADGGGAPLQFPRLGRHRRRPLAWPSTCTAGSDCLPCPSRAASARSLGSKVQPRAAEFASRNVAAADLTHARIVLSR